MSIVLAVYLVIQILVLSSLMVLQIDLTIHAITMTLACIAYFTVAFKNPGYFQGEEKQAPSLEDEIRKENQIPSDEKIIKEMDQEQDANEKSHLEEVDKQNLNAQNLYPQKVTELQANLTIDRPYIDDNIQQKIMQTKFPKHLTHNLNKINLIKTNQIDLIQKKNITQITHRYCRVCKVFQPYRVRHCHECQRCICTFDHHCPWMNNCIGQKNRNVFWVYLVLQFIEFLLVLVDIGRIALQEKIDSGIVYFFTVSIFLATILAFLLLTFHTYLMLINLTTWEFVRWDRINYLSVYSYRKSSPFSYGFVRNITDYFLPQKVSKQWTINPEFLRINKQYELNVKQGRSQKEAPQIPKLKTKLTERPQTQRAIISNRRP